MLYNFYFIYFFLPVQFVYLWHFSFLTFEICFSRYKFPVVLFTSTSTKVVKVASHLESLFEVCTFPSYFLFSPNFGFSIRFLKFVDDILFCGLLIMWSLWGYEWLGLVCRLLEGFSRIKNFYNFLLFIHVVQFLFYIFVFLPVQFVYLWHFSFLKFEICLTLCKK